MRASEAQRKPKPEDVGYVRAYYPVLENGVTMGTICEYTVDDWSWVVVTDLPDETWGDVFDEEDDRADELVVRFLNPEKLPDSKFKLFESCVGCREHAKTARLFTDLESAGNFMRRSDFLEKFEPRGPLHPDHREGGENGGD